MWRLNTLSKVTLLLLGLLLSALSSNLVLRPEPATMALREAEYLWQVGRSSEARRQFMQLLAHTQLASVPVRLAQISLLRGECDSAQRYAAQALRGAGTPAGALRRDEAAHAHLVAGQCAALAGNRRYAEAEWAAVDPRSSLHPLANLLRGEDALRVADVQAAAQYGLKALESTLGEPARSFAHLRVALALAGDAPAAAEQHVAAIPAALPAAAADIRAYMTLSSEEIVRHARQLEAILGSEPAVRGQLLGQQLLALDLHHLAIARFEGVPPDAPRVVLARAHAAVTRWELGQKDTAVEQLRELVEYAPHNPAVATMFATVALYRGQLDAASAALDVAEGWNPLDPAIMVVRSDVLVARHDFPGAVAERRRAFEVARPAFRGRYARALAELHLRLTYQLCEAGADAARTATLLEPSAVESWRLLGSIVYHCRDFAGAADAARRGLQVAPNDAELEFWLGAALWESGQRRGGTVHLRNAADFAPSSEWRRRAEEILGSAQ